MVAQDRSLLVEQARTNGLAAAIGIPGVDASGLVRSLGAYAPTQAVRRRRHAPSGAALQAAGRDGRRVLRDLDTYLAGMNTWYARGAPSARRLERADIYALNAIKVQYLGEGGGNEVAHEQLLDGLRDRFGPRRGNDAYRDLRGRNDPERSPTTPRRTKLETTSRSHVRRASWASPRSFQSCGAGARGAAATPRPQASNVLLVSGRRSATRRSRSSSAGRSAPATTRG